MMRIFQHQITSVRRDVRHAIQHGYQPRRQWFFVPSQWAGAGFRPGQQADIRRAR